MEDPVVSHQAMAASAEAGDGFRQPSWRNRCGARERF